MPYTGDPFDTALESWLAEGPMDAPREVRDVVLRDVPRLAQRRRRLPRWAPRWPLAGLATAATIAIAILAVSFIPPGQQIGTPPSPGASLLPSPSASPLPSPRRQAVTTFTIPFAFERPDTPAVGVTTYSEHFHAITSPEGSLSVWNVTAIWSDPCSEGAGTRSAPRGPAELIEYARSIDGVTVGPVVETVVDEQPALQVAVQREAEGACGKDPVLLWQEEGPGAGWTPSPASATLGVGESVTYWMVEVDGRMLVFEARTPPGPTGRGGMVKWLPVAEQIMESVSFLPES
jgi:hypothetical protein